MAVVDGDHSNISNPVGREIYPPSPRSRASRVLGRLVELSHLNRRRPPVPVPDQRTASPESGAGWFNRLTFSWLTPVMRTGHARPLETNDIWTVDPNRQAASLASIFRQNLGDDPSQPSHGGDFIEHRPVGGGASEKQRQKKQLQVRQRRLARAVYLTFRREVLLTGALRLVTDILQVMAPFTLRYLITFASWAYTIPDDDAAREDERRHNVRAAVGLAVSITVMMVVQSLAMNHYQYLGATVGAKVRACITPLVLDKAFRLSELAKKSSAGLGQGGLKEGGGERGRKGGWRGRRGKQTADVVDRGWDEGRIVNLVLVDLGRIELACTQAHMIWTTPLALLLTLALLIVNITYSALAGFGVLLAAIPAFTFAARRQLGQRRALNRIGDDRVAFTQEILRGVRLVKFCGWEASFLGRIRAIRKGELRTLRRLLASSVSVHTVAIALPIFACVASFVTYGLSGHRLNAARVFSCAALFNCIRNQMTLLPQALNHVLDAWTSLQRIQAFLAAPERATGVPRIEPGMVHAAEMDGSTFVWDSAPSENGIRDKEQRPSHDRGTGHGEYGQTQIAEGSSPGFSLRSISFALRKGELLAVIGSVGSGKTALLAALMGDMRQISGAPARLSAHAAICPERPWIQNATARENIVFGGQFDPARYRQVVEACALQPDFDLLPHGDATEVGERGVTLSGGQKQRLSLARAIYSGADVVLLDDPISAVDAHVGEHTFRHAIGPESLLAAKSRILATHQQHILGQCDRVIWLESGAIKGVGSYEVLRMRNPDFGAALVEMGERRKGAGEDDTNPEGGNEATTTDTEGNPNMATSNAPIRGKVAASAVKATEATISTSAATSTPAPALMQEEEREVNALHSRVYFQYLRAAGNPVLHALLLLLILCLAQVSMVATNLWLAYWVSDELQMQSGSYMGGYSALGFAQFLLFCAFGLALTRVSTKAGARIFEGAMGRLLGAPLLFFETNPLGRLVNRFSRDVDILDTLVVQALRLLVISASFTFTIMITVIAFYPVFAAAFVPATILVVFMARYYRPPARDLKRHESVLRSVVVARLSEALTGASSIRAYGREMEFAESITAAVDDMDSALFLSVATQRWLGVRLDCVANFMVLVTSLLVASAEFEGVDPSISAMLLSTLLPVVQLLQASVRQWTELENAMNAAERLLYYGSSIDQEGGKRGAVEHVSDSWPPHGELVFDNVQMRYRPGLPLVLDGFSLHVKAGEHVGIVGRTGAGKSSVVGALFGHAKLAGGSIAIDGVDASSVRLEDLRSRMSIIPQDPTLFQGTVRSNLDPLGRHADLDLWSALRQSGFAVGQHRDDSRAWESDEGSSVASGSSHGRGSPPSPQAQRIRLDDAVEPDGANFSLGQRQLLALARALVRSSRIIIADEATSSVDLTTDLAVQRTIASAFKDSTLLCIAHRLRTVLDYDRVCVMDTGRAIEVGSPLELFDKGLIFRSMCDKAGIARRDFPAADGEKF